jgi:hypothetical protein
VIKNRFKNLRPRSGWTAFFDSLKRYKIPSLNSGKPFKQQKEGLTGMIYVEFEVASNGKYRFYTYLEPGFYKDEDAGANDVYRFLRYFHKEMNLQVYYLDGYRGNLDD